MKVLPFQIGVRPKKASANDRWQERMRGRVLPSNVTHRIDMLPVDMLPSADVTEVLIFPMPELIAEAGIVHWPPQSDLLPGRFARYGKK